MLLSFSSFLIQGQTITLGNSTWTQINHEVSELVFINEKIQRELEKLLLCAKQQIPEEFEYYKYINLYIMGDISFCKLEFIMSNYPYKSGSNIGFFSLQDRLVLVHNKLPDFLTLTDNKKTFSYREHRIFLTSDGASVGEGIVMNEDDTPGWIIEYKNNLLNVLYFPMEGIYPDNNSE